MTMKLTSDAFFHDAEIPSVYTCEGEDVSPPLRIDNIPDGTKSLALIIDDPDAPDPSKPKMTWVHWVVYDLPADIKALARGIIAQRLPAGAKEGTNDWKRKGYGGPCPPIGKHRYFHKLYALDIEIGDKGPLTKAELEKEMDGHVIEQAELVGTYQKRRR